MLLQLQNRRTIAWIGAVAVILTSAITSVAMSATPSPDTIEVQTLAEILPPGGDPPNVEDNYTLIEEELFLTDPHLWGGAYVDGDVLVVNYVNQSEREAVAALKALGVTQGVRLKAVTVSLSDYEESIV